MWSAWTPVEIAWTAIAFVGLGLSIRRLVEFVLDWTALTQIFPPVNGAMRTLSVSMIVSEGLRAISQTLLLAAGIVAGITHPGEPARRAIALLLIIGVLVLVAQSEAVALARRRIRRMAYDHEQVPRREEA